jgi:ketosteroid isomerase-like protein
MLIFRRLSIVLAALLSAAACTSGDNSAAGATACPPDLRLTAADREAISTGLANAVQAALERDWAGFAAQFDEDVTMLPPGAPLYTGRDAIVAGFDGVTITGFVSEIDELDGCGNLAYGRGHHDWTMEIRGAAGPYSESGKWVAVWRRQDDGAWRVVVDIWNSDSLMP